MELRQLRTFVAVAELRHFARAASLCNLSQPAVSHQIALLEAELGAKLLNRAARRVSVTVAGEVFLEEARRILGAVDRAHERMQEVARGAVGRIRLGATATPCLYLLPPLLAKYRSEHESYDLRLEIAPIHDIAERVARNDLDMAIIAGPLPSGELQELDRGGERAPGCEPGLHVVDDRHDEDRSRWRAPARSRDGAKRIRRIRRPRHHGPLDRYIAARTGLRPEPFYLGIGYVIVGLALSSFLVRDTTGFAREALALSASDQRTTRVPQTMDPPTAKRTMIAVCQAGLVNNLNDGIPWLG